MVHRVTRAVAHDYESLITVDVVTERQVAVGVGCVFADGRPRIRQYQRNPHGCGLRLPIDDLHHQSGRTGTHWALFFYIGGCWSRYCYLSRQSSNTPGGNAVALIDRR